MPKKSGNVGSVARVMKNFGMNDLRVVSKRNPLKTFQAKKMAVHAEDILLENKIFLELKDAISDFSIVIGTTGKFHKDAPESVNLNELENFLSYAKENKIAFLFGPEDRGLSGIELSLCNYSLTIPSSKAYPSLNLSHAVGVVCYEIFKKLDVCSSKPSKVLAKKESLELLYTKMKEFYLEIGFLDKINPDRIMKLLRNIYGRAQLDEREVRVLLGVIKQTKWYVNNKLK